MATRLIIKREGSLLSIELSREISAQQLELVRLLLLVTDEAEDAEIEKLGLNLELSAAYSGIEQYQAESR